MDLENQMGDDLDCHEEGNGENMECELDNDSNLFYNPQVAPDLKPKSGQEFQTLEEAWSFYNAYAKEADFSVRNWSVKRRKGSDEIIRKEYVCFKQGKGKLVANVATKRKRGSVRDGCNAKLVVVKSTTDTFVVTLFVEGHSHPLSTPTKIHLLRSHLNVSSAQKSLTQQLGMVNIPSHQQFDLLGVQAGGFQNIGCTQRDLYNLERDRRNEIKGHDGDMLHEYLKLEQGKNPSFFFDIKSDDEQKITHCYWADATSRCAYNYYGDVVIFDTTYNTNRYGLIFAPLMGVNNHGQTIIFGCAFLSNETINSFVWLFNKFLEAMPGDAPKMIITDQDPAMTNAISQTFPNTFHRYCSWHILTKFSEKIDSVKYNAYYNEFSKCIWGSEMKEEFESKWLELIDRSGLNDNKWLHSMYEIRSKWVPAYVNHVFSAGMSSSQRAESSHSFFKRYVSKANSLVDFMIQFGRGLMRQRHQELTADNKDLTEKPKLKMFNDVLVQMVEIYTCEMFYKLQDEMWEILNYKFQLVDEDDAHCVCKVERKNVESQKLREIHYDKEMDFATCTCKMFESAGIPCAHLLAYLNKFHDFEKLPSQYILKRWTKLAKSGVVNDESGLEITDDKSYHLKRSRLIQMALNLVDKALTCEETTNIFTDALSNANAKIDQFVSSGNGTSVTFSGKLSCNNEHTYNEPNPVRAKGCGKRLKGGKEKALRVKNQKARRCNGCGLVGQSHDKRNCPVLTKGLTPSQMEEQNLNDDISSSEGISL